MSFPYTLDLSFGSEKPTADSIGRVSFGGSNSSKVPTTQDEINALLEERKAVVIQVNQDGIWNSLVPRSGDMPALEVTKSMIVGFVCVMQGTDGAESMFEETKPTYIPTPEGYAEGAWQFDEHALSRDYIMVITKEPMML